MDFLKKTMDIHGIASEEKVMVTDLVKIPEADGFLVNTWSFTEPGTSGISSFPYINHYPEFEVVITENRYNWGRVNEVRYTVGTQGQNNPKPASVFNNHQFLWFPLIQKYYDPSYGISYCTAQDMDNVVSGFYRERNYDIIVVKNPDNNQIKILPYQEYFLPIYSGFSVSIP